MKNKFWLLITAASLLCVAAGCTAQPTEPILADSVFSGQALLDVNANGEIDDKDTPIENANFYVELNGVKAFADTTDKTGNAFILIPGSVDYPVNVGMEAPKGSTFRSITPSPVKLQASTGNIQFLFSSK